MIKWNSLSLIETNSLRIPKIITDFGNNRYGINVLLILVL